MNIYPEFECDNCIKRGRQAERGCDTDALFAYWTDIDGNERKRCPRRPIFEDIEWYNSIIQAYNAYQAGFLPHAGGIEDQAPLFSFIMSTIGYVLSECEKATAPNNNSGGDPNAVSVLRRKR